MHNKSLTRAKEWLPLVLIAVSGVVAFTKLQSSTINHAAQEAHPKAAARIKVMEDLTLSHGHSLKSVSSQLAEIHEEQKIVREATADVRILRNDLTHVVKDVGLTQETLTRHTDVLNRILLATEK